MFTPHARAILQALLVTFIWSASWVFIKIGLEDIPALTFAGLRYSIAFLSLLIVVIFTPRIRQEIRGLTRRQWLFLAILGLIFYALAQGSQFVALDFLPAATLSLLLNFTALVVPFMGIIWLGERPTGLQWGGIAIFLLGVVLYFVPIDFPAQQWLGILAGVVGVLATSVGTVLGRSVNRGKSLSPFTITLVSMGFGSMILLGSGIAIEGVPDIQLESWLIIIWLAVVHTAFAFTLWNHTQRTLTAVETSVINNTMLIQITILAWIFLGESITPVDAVALVLATLGIIIVQVARNRKVA